MPTSAYLVPRNAVMRLPLALAAALALVACGQASDEGEGGAGDVGASEDEVVWEPISMALGNSPNFAQLGNGNTMTVVSRDFGRGAKAGALVELFYPKYATDNLWDSYVGIRSAGKKLTWAHDLKLTGQRVLDDTGIVQSDFAGEGFTLRIEDVIRQGSDAHVRRVTIENTGAAPLKGVAVDFYAFYAIGNLPMGDKIAYDEARGAFVQTDDDAKISVATVGDRAPSKVHCGYALRPLLWQRDARIAAEADDLDGCNGTNEAAVSGVNSVLEHRLDDLAPRTKKSISYAIGIAPDGANALANATNALAGGGFDARANEDRAHWASVLGRAKQPARLPPDVRAVYRRAIITMLQHRVSNGAFIAAPTLTSPVYRFVWPRDGSKTAVDLLEAGFAAEAASFFEFLETQLLADGSFAVNYFPDGSRPLFDFGKEKNENDQPGMLAWGVDRVHDVTKDDAWLAARWPAVRRVAEHLLVISDAPNAIVDESRDLWELETNKSWTYAQGSAIAGLEAAARSARTLGKVADAERYEARAKTMRDALTAKLVAPGGYFARGIDGTKIDERLEIANLALGKGGFDLVPDGDPKLAIVGDLVKQRLLTKSGGVKRYEGDRYYGGQPWPVANTWLSLHELARGDRDGAQARFDAITKMALATESKMLGEQFDEKNEKWLSAMPLVWSEAAYVRNALALYD
jgi:GH15 family glucan-1,4-alpha-glucosidase